ncbi:MAG: riboflavin synthase [Solibacillus sp.]|uniref:riboflavin synthase n=1 Tax=unclassified Solibacillus TaxID=2637870 RepID=UPI0030F9DCEA
MFTGIIEEIGTVTQMRLSRQAMELSIQATKILEDVKLGDSIAVNGVCLTVINFTKGEFTVDVMPETIKSTSIQSLRMGSKVNLERAMSLQGRFGGHIISGHVDGIATILRKRPVENAVYVDLMMEKSLLNNCILKGSITIDGTSLTIFDLSDSTITVSLIPHTYKESILGIKRVGEIVNIETDLIGKYVEKHIANRGTANITKDFLQRNGF